MSDDKQLPECLFCDGKGYVLVKWDGPQHDRKFELRRLNCPVCEGTKRAHPFFCDPNKTSNTRSVER